MASNSPRNPRIPAVIKGHRHFSYGGAVIPENVTIQQYYDITSMKRSNVRINDQLIPKPSDINMAERMIKAAIPKEHPYSSHISRLALFPSYRSPDDPASGVRAASQPVLNPLIPSSAPEVTVVTKTIGAPYRHEILEAPMASRKKAVEWTGEHGYLDQTKPVKGESQGFYPSPQKTVFPNPKLRDWNITLSERTANMLKNVERSHWITSYQVHFTGSGPANPLNMDDFNEKISDRASGGLTSHSAQLRETSHPVFVASKPREGRKSRRWQALRARKSTYRPATEPPSEAVEPAKPASASTRGPGPQETTARHNETRDPNPNLDGIIIRNYKQPAYGSSNAEAGSAEVFQTVSKNQQSDDKLLKSSIQLHDKGSKCKFSEKENCGSKSDECHIQTSESQSSRETKATQVTTAKITDTERSLALYNRQLPQAESEVNKDKGLIELCYNDVPSSKKQDLKVGANPFSLSQSALVHENTASESETGISSRAALAQEKLQKDREDVPRGTSNPCIIPRPPVLPCISPVGRGEGATLGHCITSLRELQDSFSKTEVHRHFNSSITAAAVDLRDNTCMGRKHKFYGINCYHLHG